MEIYIPYTCTDVYVVYALAYIIPSIHTIFFARAIEIPEHTGEAYIVCAGGDRNQRNFYEGRGLLAAAIMQ